MKRTKLVGCIVAAGLMMPFTGCSTGMPFGLGSGGNPFSSSGSSGTGAGSGIGSSVSSTMQKFKEGITAPFSGQKTGDAVALSTPTPKLGADVYTSAAALYEAQGNVNGAFEQYQKALQASPNDPNVLLGYARLNDRHGRFDEAVKNFNQVTQANPNNSTAFNDLGLCYAKNGQIDKAMENLNRAAQLQPNNALYRNNAARVLVQANRTDEAYNQLAAVHSPAHAHYNLGFLLQEKGDTEGAKNQFSVALQTDPNLVQARQMLGKLQGQVQGLESQVNQYTQAGQQMLNQYNNTAQSMWPPAQSASLPNPAPQ